MKCRRKSVEIRRKQINKKFPLERSRKDILKGEKKLRARKLGKDFFSCPRCEIKFA